MNQRCFLDHEAISDNDEDKKYMMRAIIGDIVGYYMCYQCKEL